MRPGRIINADTMPSSPVEVSRLLRAWGDGDQAALNQLTPLVYTELHQIAHRHMRHQLPGQTLQTTAPSVKRDWKLAKAWLTRELGRR